MSSALVSGITDVFKSQVARPFAANTGESESSVVRGFETSIGTMVEGLAVKFRHTGNANQLLDLINSPANDPRILENPRSLVGAQQGDGLTSKFTSMLFGARVSSVTDEIGSATGIRGGTAASLLTVGAPLLLGTLRKRVRDSGMDAPRLTRFLSSEADAVRGSLPARVENLITSETRSGDTVAPVASGVVDEEYRPPIASGVVDDRTLARPPARSTAWLWPLILALLILGGILWWLNSRRHAMNVPPPAVPEATAPATPAPANPAAPLATAPAAGLGEMVTRHLPGNMDINVPANGVESHLLSFIQDPSRPVDQTTWFDFDRLMFAPNSSTLLAGSGEQLRNVGAILKGYPNVHVKIGGYTDNTGNAAENMTLSQQRADAVRQQLIATGVSPDRIEAQGFGDQHPIGDNATEAGRQANRRISLRVTQK
ncbi:MAG: OmpA family protein [Bryobacterales bacterium]|nr:OmpA family protein [Bryobacterales bacterium]